MQLLDNDTFLSRLSLLFQSSKEHGTIWLTHKRLTHDGDDVTMDSADDSREYPCIIRVTDGKEAKFSTHITSEKLDKFLSAYGTLLKSSMSTLRKRDKKRERVRAEKLAERKQRLAEPILIEGPKRGKGRRKRQRRVKAALKQEDARQRMQEKQEAKEKTKV
ncbi:signal recognition particle, SRP9/SRP14 subunit [Russula earlei]|uniref:Signal recognition particle, SRP9/SRP14 subunit n=1 Tax=Russula earlei TaxID=71964 RepID=A0ACC0UJY4_9AGAM|nr:signal recognition particle, SRP9/SRP14 subunit [Russula earlei]